MQPDLFDDVVEYPNSDAKGRFERLVGLDDTKERLLKEAALLLDRGLLDDWSERHYKRRIDLVERFRERSPLFIFAGDVGTGKTELAKSFGDGVARAHKLDVQLYSLSLSARGTGAVGEMTRLISSAFAFVKERAERGVSASGQAIILLIDEADALVQSRESGQMHHEDRAGVNAVIRGVDDVGANELPVVVVMCTNRLSALDPAVRRRAASVLRFTRPNDEQRLALLTERLRDTGFSEPEIQSIAAATGATNGRSDPFTYSDLTDRFLPQILLDAYPDGPLTAAAALKAAKNIEPTPRFAEHGQG